MGNPIFDDTEEVTPMASRRLKRVLADNGLVAPSYKKTPEEVREMLALRARARRFTDRRKEADRRACRDWRP